MPPIRPSFTITVRVVQGALTFTGNGNGGSTNGAKSHRVFADSDLFFTCPDGDLLIHFKNPANGNHRPFLSPNTGVNTIVFAGKGATTPVLQTKNNNAVGTSRYTAVVARHSGPPFMVWEDPELEDGGGGGGPVAKKKAAKKKGKKSKNK